ncbi:MAG: hypothetical protein EA360_09735 [Balneolaceae bacterium]|nr:MAG: hypothetical protein EA360_09735 [Balneolaceae bacterium]
MISNLRSGKLPAFIRLWLYLFVGLFVKGFRTLNPSTPQPLNLKTLILTLTLTLTLTSAHAQSISTGDPLELYLRMAAQSYTGATTNSWTLRPVALDDSLRHSLQIQSHPWQDHPFFRESDSRNSLMEGMEIYAPRFFMSHNNNFAVGQNDGAVWQGVGWNYAFTAGFSYEYRFLKVALRPLFLHSENNFFDISRVPKQPGLTRFSMPLTWIDFPQRFGLDPITRFDPGDSYIRFQHSGWIAGFSNERIWAGPALHNALILSDNAPGFLHFFAGTEKPLVTRVGSIESRFFWGKLEQSRYFSDELPERQRMITGFTVAFSPSRIPGLTVGMNSVRYKYVDSNFRASDLLLSLRRNLVRPEEMSEVDSATYFSGMESYFFRWAGAASGFEVYGEWGRNDFRRPWRDFFSEPELNRAYTLGLLKRFQLPGNNLLLLNMELTTLENSSISSQYRENNTWYSDEVIIQGYTHRGQAIGAGIGPGSSTQYVKLSYYNRWGMAGASVGRVVWHNDRLYNNWEYFRDRQFMDSAVFRALHEVEIRYGLYALIFLPMNLELQADFRFSAVENRWQRYLKDEKNTHMMFTLRYQLPGWNR